MIADRVRVDAYSRALQHTIKSDSVVLDLGSGTGLFALLSCRLGARKVYAIEPSDAIGVARQSAIDNGFQDRIEFYERSSMDVELPERADVIVSDLRGVLPWCQGHIPSIIDARHRFLIRGGVLLPRRDMLWMAVVDAPDHYTSHVVPWERSKQDLGIDWRAPRAHLVNTWTKCRFDAEHLISEPRCWATLDYRSVQSGDVRGQAKLEVVREGLGHGLVVWFDAEIAEGVGFSNAPGAPPTIYGSAFFPWSQPVPLKSKDSVTVDFRADLLGEDYVWSWDTAVRSARDYEGIRTRFRQSTFQAAVLSPDKLRKREIDHVPSLTQPAEVDRFVLSLMDGQTTVREIAVQIADQFPEQFADWRQALDRVGELSLRYSQ